MEIFSKSHKALQIFCAGFWDTAADCELILGDVGIDSTRINLAEPSLMRWYSIIRELIRKNDGSMAVLVDVLMKQYPENKSLSAVCAPWIPSQPAKSAPVESATPEAPLAPSASVPTGAVLVKKFETKPELVPVVAPLDFAEEAEEVIPRIETLWAAMIDVEQRLVELEQWRNQPQPAKKKG